MARGAGPPQVKAEAKSPVDVRARNRKGPSFRELQKHLAEAVEQQKAISEILRVISTSPGDVKPILDAVAESALKLCDAADATIFLVEDDKLRSAARFGSSPTPVQEGKFIPRTRGSVTGRAVIDCAVVHVEDLATASEEEFPVGRELQRRLGHHTALSVPLMRQTRAIGAIALWRMEARRFTDEQVALVKTFADQGAIAIENVRLFKELQDRNHQLTESLEQQTATSEVLKVISRSAFDLQPVLETLIENAARLCGADQGFIYRFDGEFLRMAVDYGTSPEFRNFRQQNPPRPGDGSIVGRAAANRRTVHIPDVLTDPEYKLTELQKIGGYRSLLSVPMIRKDILLGVIHMWRTEAKPFTEKQIELATTFADQAVIAIENVRLFTELEARTAQLTRSVSELKALGEVGQAVSSTLDLETVLSTIVSRATQLAGMDGGSIWEYDETRQEFYLRASERLPDELVAVLRAAPIRKGEGALGRLTQTGEPVEIRDIADERSYQSRVREILIRSGYRSVLAVPLLREDRLLGALAISRNTAGEFAPDVIGLLKTFATQSALAIQNARLYREIEVKSRELETASRHKSEFLANMSHELRTPLNAIIGFSEVLSERIFGEINDKQAEYLGDILESGRHLLSLINDILDLSKIEAGRMELEPTEFDLPTTIENTLILVRERAQRRSVMVVRAVDERLGTIRGDERKVKQVLLNLLSNALKFTPEGGQIEVRAEVRGETAEISVRDTGVGIALEDQEAIFEEFRQVGTASKKIEGTGLGLAISRNFVELHGGRIWVTSQVGSGSTFTFTLPLSIELCHQTG